MADVLVEVVPLPRGGGGQRQSIKVMGFVVEAVEFEVKITARTHCHSHDSATH